MGGRPPGRTGRPVRIVRSCDWGAFGRPCSIGAGLSPGRASAPAWRRVQPAVGLAKPAAVRRPCPPGGAPCPLPGATAAAPRGAGDHVAVPGPRAPSPALPAGRGSTLACPDSGRRRCLDEVLQDTAEPPDSAAHGQRRCWAARAEWTSRMRMDAPGTCHGITLVELLATTAILAIVAALAAPGMKALLERQRTASALHALTTRLALARTAAITSRTPVTFCPSRGDGHCTGGTDWSAGWLVYRDPQRR